MEQPKHNDIAGGENIIEGTDVRSPEISQNVGQDDALVVQERKPDPDKVNVHETYIATDERVYGVAIVPPEGRGFLDLPMHALDGPRVEDVFAEHAAADEDESADEAPAESDE